MSRILLVDDDIAEISAVKRALSRGGHQPLLATNASDALAALGHDPPALIVLSATCEGGEALALGARLASDPSTAGIPVVVLGDGEPLPSGARRLARPVDPELLQAEVAAALGAAGVVELPPPAGPEHAAPSRSANGKQAATLLGRVNLARPERMAPLDGAAASLLAAAAEEPDPSAVRRAAADALRARAEELRRASTARAVQGPAPAPAESAFLAALPGPALAAPALAPAAAAPAPKQEPAARVAAPPAAAAKPRAAAPRPARPPLAPTLELEEDGLEAAFRAATSTIPAPAPEIPLPAHVSTAPPPDPTPAAFELDPPGPAPERDGAPEPAVQAEAPRPSREDARRAAAEEALRTLEEEASGHAVETARRARDAQRKAAEAKAREDAATEAERRATEERARAEAVEQARREAFEEARQQLEARARIEAAEAAERSHAEARARDEAVLAARSQEFEEARRELEERARDEAAEAARLVQAEARARQEAVQAARREATELARREAEEKQRASDAERRADAEGEARRRAEEELAALRHQLEQERKTAEERLTSMMERAAAEEEAADTLRRQAEDDARRRTEEDFRARTAEEDRLRAAITSARSEMETLRRRGEDEARRRAEAEDALARFAEEPPPAPEPTFTPPPFFAPFEAEVPEELAPPAPALPLPAAPPDPAEEAARRRVAALRAGAQAEAREPPAAPPPSRTREPARAPSFAPPEPAPEAPPELPEPTRPLPPPPAELRVGTLAELPVPRLLALCARHRLVGRLDFQGDAARSLWFEDGKVVGATSADPSERVEELALRLGLVTRDQYRQVAQAAAALPARRAALLLVERGFVKPTELTGLVRRRTEEVLFGVFADPDGRFRWAASEVLPEERIGLDRATLALAVEGVRRRWLAPRVDALLGGPGTLLVPAQGGPAIADLGLSPEERRAVAAADGLRTLDEVVQASPLDPLTTRQVLAALVLVDALTVRLLQAGRPQAAAATAIDLARVRDKLDQVRRADYFTVLGVGRLCTPHEVREAADRLAAEFDPRRHAGVREEGLPAKLAEVLQVVRDARDVLADDRLRQEYLRGLGD